MLSEVPSSLAARWSNRWQARGQRRRDDPDADDAVVCAWQTAGPRAPGGRPVRIEERHEATLLLRARWGIRTPARMPHGPASACHGPRACLHRRTGPASTYCSIGLGTAVSSVTRAVCAASGSSWAPAPLPSAARQWEPRRERLLREGTTSTRGRHARACRRCPRRPDLLKRRRPRAKAPLGPVRDRADGGRPRSRRRTRSSRRCARPSPSYTRWPSRISPCIRGSRQPSAGRGMRRSHPARSWRLGRRTCARPPPE